MQRFCRHLVAGVAAARTRPESGSAAANAVANGSRRRWGYPRLVAIDGHRLRSCRTVLRRMKERLDVRVVAHIARSIHALEHAQLDKLIAELERCVFDAAARY